MNSPRHADDYASDDNVSDDDVSDNDVSDDDASDDDVEDDDASDDDVSDDASFDDSDSAEGDPYCSGCERQFVCMNALNQHLFDSPKHNWCFDCSRDFSSEMSLLNVSRVYSTAFPISHSSNIGSTKTLSPIADVISNALSATGCSRARLASPNTSNPDATRSRGTKSLLQFAS
jgi:hypothetical protein